MDQLLLLLLLVLAEVIGVAGVEIKSCCSRWLMRGGVSPLTPTPPPLSPSSNRPPPLTLAYLSALQAPGCWPGPRSSTAASAHAAALSQRAGGREGPARVCGARCIMQHLVGAICDHHSSPALQQVSVSGSWLLIAKKQ